MSQVKFRIKEEHWEVILQFMENHSDFANGFIYNSSGRDTYKKLWQDLTLKLNSLGYGERPTEKWQKAWSDFKSNLKKKASQIKDSQKQTGGGPPLDKKLNNIELRDLNIIGRKSYEGCGTKEIGLEHVSSKYDKPTASTLGSELKQQELSPNNSENITASTSVNEKRDFESVDRSLQDHDYIPKIKKLKAGSQSKQPDEMYGETLGILKNIENTISRGFQSIEHTVKEGFKDLNETLDRNLRKLSETRETNTVINSGFPI